MGWWGVVFKGDISSVSDQLAIGLTTGYLGSLTTFSGWNQKMLDLSVDGQWVFSVLGFLIGNLSFCKNHVIVEALTAGPWAVMKISRFNYISWSPYSNLATNTQQYRRIHLL